MPYFDENHNPTGIIVFVRDVSDRVNREKDLSSLVDISKALRNTTTRQDVLRISGDIISEALNLDGLLMVSQSLTGPGVLIEEAHGFWKKNKGQTVSVANELLPELFVHQAQYYPAESIPDEYKAMFSQWLQDLNLAALALIPLSENTGETDSVLVIGSKTDISPEDYRLLNTMVEFTVSALQRNRLTENTLLRLRRMNAIHFVGMAISSSFDWHVTFNVLLSQAVHMLAMDAACILVFDEDTQFLSYGLGIGFNTNRIHKTRLRIGESLAGKAALKRETIFFADLSEVDDRNMRLFNQGGEDFIGYCAAPLISKGQIKGVLELFNRRPLVAENEWLDFLEMLASQAAIAIDNADLFEDLQRSNSELTQAYDLLIVGWSRALELRDAETHGHANRLVDLALKLARKMGVPDDNLVSFRRGVLLHDIGKMGVPDSILLKPGPLTEEEWQVMRMHPIYANELLTSVAYLKPVAEVPFCHHERWNGSGYPRGLKGDEIPLTARLFSVIDIWDALTTDRPYRRAWSKEKTVAYLQEQAGSLLDPQAVDAFIQLITAEGILPTPDESTPPGISLN